MRSVVSVCCQTVGMLVVVVATVVSGVRTGQERYIITAAETVVSIPVGSVSNQWRPFQTVGVSLILPSTLTGFDCVMGLTAGRISLTESGRQVQSLHGGFDVLAELPFRVWGWKFAPFAGITSMMVGGGEGKIDILSLKVFDGVENEYGFRAGVIPIFSWNRLVVQLPVYGESILSRPYPFTTIGMGIRIGFRTGDRQP